MQQGPPDYSTELKVRLVQARPRGHQLGGERGDAGGERCVLLGEGAGRLRAAGLSQKTRPASHTTKMRKESRSLLKYHW